MKKLHRQWLDVVVVSSFVATAVWTASWMLSEHLISRAPIEYDGAHVALRVWSAMESAALEQQSDRIRDQDMFMKGYEKGVEDVRHGRRGFSSDAEGLCYTMLTQDQARRFLDELTKMRMERP